MSFFTYVTHSTRARLSWGPYSTPPEITLQRSRHDDQRRRFTDQVKHFYLFYTLFYKIPSKFAALVGSSYKASASYYFSLSIKPWHWLVKPLFTTFHNIVPPSLPSSRATLSPGKAFEHYHKQKLDVFFLSQNIPLSNESWRQKKPNKCRNRSRTRKR